MKTNKKILGAILTTLSVVLLLSLGLLTAQTAPWLTGWEYRKPITIQENSGTALTDYQVKIDVSYTPGMNSDFSDLRFTEDDGTTLLPYWIEEYTTGSTATAWVNVPNIPASGTTTIYMYYGNSGATSESNGSAVFQFFDDFESTNLDTNKWDLELGTEGTDFEIADGYFHGMSDNVYRMTSKNKFGTNLIWEYKTRTTASDGYNNFHHGAGSGVYGSNWHPKDGLHLMGETKWYSQTEKNDVRNYYDLGPSNTDWHIFSIERIDYTNVKTYIDGTLQHDHTNYIPTVDLGAWMRGRWAGSGGTYTDWFRIREYASVEPTVTFGGEEPEPTTTTTTATTTTTSTTTTTMPPNLCSDYSDWVSMDVSHGACTGGLDGCVRDGNGNGEYDQICCSGFVEGITPL